MGLSDSQLGPCSGYLFPPPVACAFTLAPMLGLPGSLTDLSLRADSSHPDKSGDCFYLLLHRQFQASSTSGGLATCIT